MPTVRPYQQQVRTAALPIARVNTRAPEGAFSGGVDIAPAASVLMQQAQREKQRTDQVALLEQDTAAQELALAQETKATARKGKDALAAPAEALAEYDKGVSEIEGNIASPDQKALFRARAIQHRFALHTSVERHAAAESERYDAQTTDAAIGIRFDTALKNYRDSTAVNGAIAETRAILGDYATRQGWSPERRQEMIAAAVSKTHTGVIDRMLTAGDDLSATSYYATHKADVTGADALKVDKALEVGSTEGAAMRGASDVWSTLGPKSSNDPVKIADMEDAARKKFADQPKIAKATIAELRTRAGAFNAQQSELKASNVATVLGRFNEGAPLSQLVLMPEYRALSGSEQTTIKEHVVSQRYADSERAYTQGQRAETEQMKRGMAAYWDLSNPTKLAGLSEAQIVAKQPEIGRTLVTQLLERKRSLVKTETAVHAATIDDDQFKTLAAGAGFKPYDTKLSAEDKATLGVLKNTVESEIDAAQQVKGKLLTRDEKQAIMARVIDRKVMISEWGRDPERIAAVVPIGDRGAAYVPLSKIPQDNVARLKHLMRLNGVEVTDDRLQRAHAAALLGDEAQWKLLIGETKAPE